MPFTLNCEAPFRIERQVDIRPFGLPASFRRESESGGSDREARYRAGPMGAGAERSPCPSRVAKRPAPASLGEQRGRDAGGARGCNARPLHP